MINKLTTLLKEKTATAISEAVSQIGPLPDDIVSSLKDILIGNDPMSFIDLVKAIELTQLTKNWEPVRQTINDILRGYKKPI
jgi:hypothetical protein